MTISPELAGAPEASAASAHRDTLLRTAARLFREKGYERTTVRDLAKAVGLQSGSLFHHFDSKADILAEVMEQGLTVAGERATSVVVRESTPEARLEALFRGYLTTLLSEDCRDHMTVLLYDFRSLTPELAQRVHRVRSVLEDRWQSILNDALPPGRTAARTRLTGQFVFGAMCWALQWYNEKGALTLDELAEEFTDLAFATCGLSRRQITRKPPARKVIPGAR